MLIKIFHIFNTTQHSTPQHNTRLYDKDTSKCVCSLTVSILNKNIAVLIANSHEKSLIYRCTTPAPCISTTIMINPNATIAMDNIVYFISPLDDWFETRFYNYITVAAMLILYGVLFILVENRRTAPHVTRLEQITYREAFIIGVWQMLAIIPGTSRSGATIVGGLLLGLSRACVAEFTFFLAIPVMAGASLLKVVKFVLSGAAMTGTEIAVLVVGCVVAFVVSLAAIRFLMDYVKRHNFKFFGLYRIVLGLIVLAVAAITAIA